MNTHMTTTRTRRRVLVAKARPPMRHRRGFNLIELLIALAISAMLLTATFVALDASFTAYQATTKQVSTQTISRLAMHRMLSLIRTSTAFGPLPADPLDPVVHSTYMDFVTANGQSMRLEWVEADEALYVATLDDEGSVESSYVLLEGVAAQTDGGGELVAPFTLEYVLGSKLRRATIDMLVIPDDNLSVSIEGEDAPVIRLIGSAMPRVIAYNE